MERIRKVKNGVQQKWDGLPHHHRLAVGLGLLAVSLFLIVGIYLLNDKLRAASSAPEPFIFRAIVENTQPKNLILRGNIIGSKGKVCFSEQKDTEKKNCPIEFPVHAWSRYAVRAEIATGIPTSGKLWLINGKGIESNVIEISF